MSSVPTEEYRKAIDALVHETKYGQGQNEARSVVGGIYHPYPEATGEDISFNVGMNALVAKLSVEERELLARMCTDVFRSGVFNTLNLAEYYGVISCDSYEGVAEDYIGRLDTSWEWPEG